MDENVTAAVPRPDVITAEVQKMRAHPLCPEKIPSHRPGQDLHAIAQAGARRDKYFGWVSEVMDAVPLPQCDYYVTSRKNAIANEL